MRLDEPRASGSWQPAGPPRAVGWIEPERRKHLPPNWFSKLDEVRIGRVSFDARNPAHWLAGAIVGFVLALLILAFVGQVITAFTGGEPEAASSEGLAIGLWFNLVFFTVPAVVWTWVMYQGGWRALATRLLLRSDNLFIDVFLGIGLGLAGIIVSVIVSLLFSAAGGPTENPVIEDLSKRLTWGLVFLIPFVAAVSEEIFFRAFLQARIGIVAGSVVFGFVHLSYQTPLQVIVPLLLGLVLTFGMLWRRSLVPALVGHFVFNFVVLLLLKVVPASAWARLVSP